MSSGFVCCRGEMAQVVLLGEYKIMSVNEMKVEEWVDLS